MTQIPLAQLFSLSGQAALVTGGAQGIGRAIALRLAEAGAAVLVADIDEVEGAATVRQIETAGGKARFLRADGASVEDAYAAAAACVESFGRLDVLVNNAGIFPASPALETSEALWDRVLAVNLKGAFFYAQAAARYMVEAGGGSIVNIASIDAFHPTGALAHYDASKGGMVMMTRSLALELGKAGVRVNVVAPGGVNTPGAADATRRITDAMGLAPDQLMAAFQAKIPLGRMGEPDDIAGAVLFLASPAARYVTGASLVVDGGFLVA